MKYWFLCILFLCVVSVSCKRESPYIRDPNLTQEEQAEDEKCNLIADQITYSFSQKMKKEYGLEAVGFGGGGDGKKINMLSVSFNSYEKVDLAQARKLLIECVQEFVEEINSREEFKSCVGVWPFTFENVSIDILFIKDRIKRGFIPSPYIASAGDEKGVLIYMEKINDKLEIIKEETYEEALSILDQK